MQKIKHDLRPILLIIALLVMCLIIPVTMVYIAFQAPDDIVLDEAVPLNKKQGLPSNSDAEKNGMPETI